MPPILYSPLRRCESRLIHLHPGQWPDPVSFTLYTFSLQPPELPFFEAVSYTWGDQIMAPVICSGMTTQVTKSVETLLRRFRLIADTRLLWVDALCINQDDIQERTDQVQAMDLIYQRASRVLIYLGEADDYSDSAMDAIAERKTSTGSIQKKVLDFFEHRSWFSRVWVLQEVALADCALAICGSKCVPWANFPAWWAQNAAYLQDRIPPSILAYNPAMKKSFLQQLHDTRVSRATDPRDKVYALAGILSPEDRFVLAPDYRKSVAEIYAEVAAKIIKHQSSLRILSATQPFPGEQCPKFDGTSGSWVPNWSKESLLTSLGLSNLYLEPYDAGGSIALTKFETREEMDFLHIKCYGITLDVIQETGSVCPIEAPGESIAKVLNEWNDLISLPEDECFKLTSRLGKGIFFVGEQFFLVDPASDVLWPTIRAQPSTTLELTPDELAKREACPVTIDGLKFCLGRRFLMTKSGLPGLAPPLAIPGDIIAILLGAPVPHVLRKKDSYYTLVGECYVNGVMNGEALAHLSKEIALQVPGHRVRPFQKSKSTAPLEWFLIE